jgi:GNAT superfamily N-acetyltransferase/putative sterol carrier protein
LVPRDSDGFASAMRGCAEQGVRDPRFATSDRVDALEALATMNRPEKGEKGGADKPCDEEASPAVQRLAAEDPYTRLVAGFELAVRNDARGLEALRELSTQEDEALQAMAALILARCGEGSAGERLLDLAPRQDARFALDAGYALQKLGVHGWQKLSLEELTMADGTKPGGYEIDYDGCRIDVFPTVDGYKVANVMYCIPQASHFPHNTHVSCLEIGWVHTDPRYRRKNLARLAMARVFEHRAAQDCSCTELGTGTRNVAHTLYRSFGFTDVAVGDRWTHDLDTEPSGRMPEGVSLRSCRAGDERALAQLARECGGASRFQGAYRASPFPPDCIVKVAERDGEMVGAVICGFYGEEGWIEDMWLKERKPEGTPDEGASDDRAEIGAALLGRVHAELRELGAKKVGCGWARGPHNVREALAMAGYRPSRSGGVWMWGLLDLPKLLREIAPLLERRLEESDFRGWTGVIDLLGEKHRARLVFTEGKIAVADPRGEARGLILTCDDDILTRIVRGIETPFEAYLQLRLTIQPQVNEQITKLLGVIFPSCAVS